MKMLLNKIKSSENLEENEQRKKWLADRDGSYIRYSQQDALSGRLKDFGSRPKGDLTSQVRSSVASLPRIGSRGSMDSRNQAGSQTVRQGMMGNEGSKNSAMSSARIARNDYYYKYILA